MKSLDAIAARPNFICWAGVEDERWIYAIIDPKPFSGIAWARYSKYDGKPVEESGGAFYDGCADHPEGAIEWAKAAARRHLEKVHALLASPV